MYLAVVGDTTVVDSFRLIGIEGAVPKSSEEAAETVRRLVEDGAVVLVSQSLARDIADELDGLRAENRDALLLEIPDLSGEPTQAEDTQRLIERAIGMKL